MSQLEPMSEEEIREFIAFYGRHLLATDAMKRLILSWIHAQAMREKAEMGGGVMSQLEPMSEEEIREFIASYGRHLLATDAMKRLILSWIHAQAMREKAETWDQHHRCADNLRWPPNAHQCDDKRHNYTEENWITAVKARIGFKDE